MLRKSVLFIAFLTISISNAFSCGFYPWGEEIRYNFLKPHYMFPKNGDHFFYSSLPLDYGYYDETDLVAYFEENCNLWKKTFGDRYSYSQVYELIYVKSAAELKGSKEDIVQFLHQKENLKYLDYLLFAKSISNLNCQTADMWELEDKSMLKNRKLAWGKALKKAKAETDSNLKRRYAHLAIRLAFYNNNEEVVNQIYGQYFHEGTYTDAIDYWALHFKLQFEPSSAERDVKIALVFLNSLEKRNAVYRLRGYYSVREQLDVVTNDAEKLAVLYMDACHNYYDLDEVKDISIIDPSHPCLDFLALREINKLEDWVLTPNYMNFSSSTSTGGWSYETGKTIREGVKQKREYAKKVLGWMREIEGKRVTNKVWWKLMIDYCSFIAGENQNLESDDLKAMIADNSYTPGQHLFLKKFYLLNVFSKDEDPELKNEYVRELLMQDENRFDQKLMIALAKELESHHHLDYSSIMFSKVNEYNEANQSLEFGYWRTDNLAETLGDDFYYNYFEYLDATLTTPQVQSLINHIQYKKVTSDFDHWFYDRVKNEFTRFYDMLGTKYMRKDDLISALSAFNQVEDSLWSTAPYSEYIGQNPFSNDFYGKSDNRHRKEVKGDYTKPKIVAELMKQINIVNTSGGDKKALAAFKVANCYRNMSFYGNSWMMRRYYWTLHARLSGLEDDEEYFKCLMAQKYYAIAEQSATKKDFKVISLIMNGLCQKYEMAYEDGESFFSYDDYSYRELRLLDKLNPAYKKFKKEYGKDYPYAIGNCDSYEDYYKSITNK